MTIRLGEPDPRATARVAGLLYLVIIVCGLFGELVVRGRIVVPGDAAATAERLRASEGLFRLGFAGDLVMAASDVALAVVLYALLRRVHATLALVAAAFRLVQAAILGANLLHHLAPLLLLDAAARAGGPPTDHLESLALVSLDLHRHGYDLGLVFFGFHCLALAVLLHASRYVPRLLAVLVALAGVVYLAGSFTLFLAPGRAGAVQPLYLVPVVAEVSLCLWLLIRGVRVAQRATGE